MFIARLSTRKHKRGTTCHKPRYSAAHRPAQNAVMRHDNVKAAAYRRQHAERQHIDFQHAGASKSSLSHSMKVHPSPLPIGTSGSAARAIQNADMLRQVTRKADVDRPGQSGGNTRRVRVKPCLNDISRGGGLPPHQFRASSANIARTPMLSPLPAERGKCDGGGDTRSRRISRKYIDDRVPLVLEININIGRLNALGRDETLKQ